MGSRSRALALPRKRCQSSLPGSGELFSGRETFQFHIGLADVELERLSAAEQFTAARQTGLAALPGQSQGARSGAHAVPLLALLLGLLGRQYDGPGHPFDGRGAVVQRRGIRPVSYT